MEGLVALKFLNSAKLPNKIFQDNFFSLIWIDIFPTVATVAADEPEIAANKAHPTTLTCIKPPGNFCIQGDKPSKRFSDNFVLNNISPIHTNNGKAVKVHEEDIPQIVVAIASPTGRDVNKVIAIVETPIMLNATQMPVLRNNRRTEIKNKLRNISVIIIKIF